MVFVRTDRGVLVVKGSASIVQEMFAAEVVAAIGLPTPRLRQTSYRDAEWHELKAKLADLARADTDRVNGEQISQKLRGGFDRPNLMIMELMSGAQMLEGMSPQEVATMFDDGTAAGLKRLRELGAIVAVDVLLNNSDRIPCGLWDNDGNARNVLLSSGEDGHVIAIDQTVTTMDVQNPVSARLIERHEKRLRAFLADSLSPTEVETSGSAASESPTHMEGGATVQRIFTFLRNETLLESTAASRLAVLRGLQDAIIVIAALPTSFFADLKGRLRATVTPAGDWQNVWGSGLACIHVSFLDKALQLFQEAVANPKYALAVAAAQSEASKGSSVVRPWPGGWDALPTVDLTLDGAMSQPLPPRSPGPNEAVNPNWSRFKDEEQLSPSASAAISAAAEKRSTNTGSASR